MNCDSGNGAQVKEKCQSCGSEGGKKQLSLSLRLSGNPLSTESLKLSPDGHSEGAREGEQERKSERAQRGKCQASW